MEGDWQATKILEKIFIMNYSIKINELLICFVNSILDSMVTLLDELQQLNEYAYWLKNMWFKFSTKL